MVRRLNEYIDKDDLRYELVNITGFEEDDGKYIFDCDNGFTAYADLEDYTGWIDFDNGNGVAHDVGKVYDLSDSRQFEQFNDLVVDCFKNRATELVEDLLLQEGFEWLNEYAMVQDFGDFEASYEPNRHSGKCVDLKTNYTDFAHDIRDFVNLYCQWLNYDWENRD